MCFSVHLPAALATSLVALARERGVEDTSHQSSKASELLIPVYPSLLQSIDLPIFFLAQPQLHLCLVVTGAPEIDMGSTLVLGFYNFLSYYCLHVIIVFGSQHFRATDIGRNLN